MLLTIGSLLMSQALRPHVVSAQGDPFRSLYDNDERFNELSGAARTVLELKFGKKDRKGKFGTGAPASEAGIRGAQSAGNVGGNVETNSALISNLVNDPSADTTAQDTQSETTLVALGSTLVAAFNDSGSHLPSSNNHFTGFSRSTDAGASWTDKGLLPLSTDGDAGDPVLARDNISGTIYFATLSFSGSSIQMFRSSDGGDTLIAPVNGAPGKTGQQDKAWIAVDNFAGSGQGNVYLIERDFGAGNGIYFFRSTDGGNTYGPSGGTLIASGAANNVQGAFVAVGSDHSVYAFYYDQSSPQAIRVKRSTDQGQTFGATMTVTTLTSFGTNGDLSLGGFRSNSFPQAAVNPVSGNIYVVYNDPSAASGGDRGNIFFRQSTDGGATWSAATQVNTDATTKAQFMPSLAVKPDGSGLAFSWYDRRRDPADTLIERWGVTASISGATITFGPNFKVSNAQWPAVFGVDPVVNSTYMGDYDHMAADNSLFYTTWGDNRDQSIAVPSRKNANVRFVKFSMAGPGPIVDFASATVGGGNGNGRIDPNECDDLTVKIINDGSAQAGGISVTLSTSTPGVTITNPTQSYSDLNPGAMAQNIFQVSTPPSIACPSTITFTLVANYAGGSDTSTFTLPVGPGDYVITSSTGALIEPGTSDTGNHGDDVTTTVSLPFSYQLYGTPFTSVKVSSNGNLQFVSNSTEWSNTCLPTSSFNLAILAHWDDLRTDSPGGVCPGCGIFTSTTGVAPNRIFNIEWRTVYFSSSTQSANFEVRVYEGQQRFDIIYGRVDQGGSGATVGVQKDTGISFTQFECNQAGALSSGLQLACTLPPCVDGNGVCGGSADQAITKNDSPDPVVTGSNITYTINLINNGPDAAGNVAVSDTVPANSTFVSAAGPAGWTVVSPLAGGTGTVTFNKASVANVETAIFTIVVNVNCNVSNGTVISNMATVTSSTSDSAPSNNSAVATTSTSNSPPIITCPADITAQTRANKCLVVNYPAPTANDNCPGTTIVSSPSSGFCFPVGTTTVTSTATDSGGKSATCTFNVTVVKRKGGGP